MPYANSDKEREYQKKYHAAHREEANAYRREWMKNHPGAGAAYSAKWYRDNRERALERGANNAASCKEAVVNIYTNGEATCRGCGHGDIDVLTIDHIDDSGAEHRVSTPYPLRGMHMYRWLIKHNYPAGFQVLCFNCNAKKEILRVRKGD